MVRGNFVRSLLCCLLLLLLTGCRTEEESLYQPQYAKEPVIKQATYIFAVHPLHNPERLFEIYQPLVEWINRQLPEGQLRLEASRNYAAFEEKLFAGHVHFALPNPYQTITAIEHGYRVFGKMGDDEQFRGIILVRRDSGIEEISDLRGKAISYPAATALAATMMPQWFLHTHGLHVLHDVDNRYVGSQESAMMNVYLRHTAAGATWILPWRAFSRERPELAKELVVKWQTDKMPNNSLMVRHDVPDRVVQQVGEILFNLQNHAPGKAILQPMALSSFEAADNSTYQPVQEFLQRFAQEVRPLRVEP
ncbi:phosphate/phosphite/phosphonate ABC transporter substrate-binding protein [Candidatus Magnetaquicoccus inordinatus]|uniref:phosphate/phosphite/phosphonate ABC transporter substrate-binding protein n=1 Tax=Candidatus Magnetaquicoccus inordinatus TaxID=2496818 RepID=UPI00102C9405|nr:PhnD/SsuA/transferrin family substrate-binding protein [Candidatus Magnetaquicoccus inordinatus]